MLIDKNILNVKNKFQSASYENLRDNLVSSEMSQTPNRFPSYPNQTGYPQGGMMPNQMGMNQGMMNAYEKVRTSILVFWTIRNREIRIIISFNFRNSNHEKETNKWTPKWTLTSIKDSTTKWTRFDPTPLEHLKWISTSGRYVIETHNLGNFRLILRICEPVFQRLVIRILADSSTSSFPASRMVRWFIRTSSRTNFMIRTSKWRIRRWWIRTCRMSIR